MNLIFCDEIFAVIKTLKFWPPNLFPRVSLLPVLLSLQGVGKIRDRGNEIVGRHVGALSRTP